MTRRGRPQRTGSGQSLSLVGVATTILAGLASLVLAQSAPSRDPAGAIAYIDPTGHVAVVDPLAADPGADATSYGRGRQLSIFPVWSSDGNRVAVITATSRGSRVELIDVAGGGEPLALLSAADRGPIYLNWSPDDDHLAVLSSAPDGSLVLDFVDVPAALAGKPVITTLGYGQPFYWVWSSTGRSVMVHRDVMRRQAVVGMSSIAGFDVGEPLPSPGAFQSPDISDSGRYLAYATTTAAENSVVVTGNPERGYDSQPVVTLAHRGLVAFAWRPGHEQLSVQGAKSEGSFTGDLELLDVRSGVATTLSVKDVVASFWSPDGRWIATLSRRSGSEEVVVQRGADVFPAQGRGPRFDLDLIEVDTLQFVEHGPMRLTRAFVSQYLPFFDQYSRSHSLWSPDSTAFVLPELAPGEVPRLVVLGIEGERTELVEGDMPAWNVR